MIGYHLEKYRLLLASASHAGSNLDDAYALATTLSTLTITTLATTATVLSTTAVVTVVPPRESC